MPAFNGWAEEEPTPPPQQEGTEDLNPEGKIVRNILIRGNQRVDKGAILRMLRSRIGRPFSRKTWDEDFKHLTESGYFSQVRTTPPLTTVGGLLLVVDLIEMANVKRLEFKGNKSVGDTEMRGAIKTTVGGRYDEGQVAEDRHKIEKLYTDKAFRDIKIEYEIEIVSSHKQLVGNQEVDVPDEVVVTFKVDEGNPVSIRSVKFIGTKAFTDEELLAAMASKPRRLFRPGDLKDAELDIDKKRLELFYQQHGYMDVNVEKVDIQLSDETYFNWFRKRKKLADVTITLTEGNQYFLGELKISGNTSIELTEIMQALKLKPGSVFSIQILQDDAQRIKDLYGERGRVFTRVETDQKVVVDAERLKKQPNLFDAEIRIQEGNEVTVRMIIPRGNTKTKDKVLYREVPLVPGERVDTTKLRYAQQALKNLNYFEQDIRITPEPVPDNPEQTDLYIDVTEKPTGEFNFGVGYSSVDKFLGQVSLTQHNFDYKDFPKSFRDFLSGNSFTGAGETFGINVSAGTVRQNYSVNFTEPWAFDRPIRLGTSVFHTSDNSNLDFKETTSGFSVSVGKRLWGPRWDGDITYTFSYDTIDNTSTGEPPILHRQTGSDILSSVRPRLVYDSRDNRILPSRGLFMELSSEIGGGPFGGSLDWVRPSLNLARYFTIFKLPNGGKHILELSGNASLIQEYWSTKDIPPFMRYYAGGIGSIRGFQASTIAPLEGGFLIGGKRSVTGTAEYSVPLYEEIVRGSIFADAGTVSDAGKTDPGYKVTDPNGLRSSVGIGLQIRTPFSPLPLRIYFSRAIQKQKDDRTKTIDFTFGTRF